MDDGCIARPDQTFARRSTGRRIRSADHLVAVGAELQADGRKATGEGLSQVMDEHLQLYGNRFGSFVAAKG